MLNPGEETWIQPKMEELLIQKSASFRFISTLSLDMVMLLLEEQDLRFGVLLLWEQVKGLYS